ncbi:MAG: amidohydrolase, partial [Acidobacteria bacterium]|nr:amidohydrolase [Acidobacteriota bacterium]
MARTRFITLLGIILLLALVSSDLSLFIVQGQDPQAPPQLTLAPNRGAEEGRGPFKTLVIRGAILIDGTGAPPQGPVDITIENNRIRAIRSAGTPGLPLRPNRQPQNADLEIDATGMYVLPGLVDLHVHAGGRPKNSDAEYPYKLWLAHGMTTVRGVPLASNQDAVKEKERSARNEIVAPRIFNYQRPGSGWDKGPVDSPEAARAWVSWAANNGVDGLKLGAHRPEIMAALLSEAKLHGMGSTAHLQQTGVAQMNALRA